MSCRIRRTQMMAQANCEKPADPIMKKELDTKLAQMQAERVKQDQMWTTPTNHTNGNICKSSNSEYCGVVGNPNS
jgi:hypothetical protein